MEEEKNVQTHELEPTKKPLKEKDFVDGVEVTLSVVTVETNPKNNVEVSKVIFETNKGNITFKPKISRSTFQDGLKIVVKEPITVGEVPDKVREIGRIAAEKGRVKVLVSYNVWNTEKDGEPITYRFITSEKTLDTWKIIPEEIVEEKIE